MVAKRETVKVECSRHGCNSKTSRVCTYCHRRFCATHIGTTIATTFAEMQSLRASVDYGRWKKYTDDWQRTDGHPCPEYTLWWNREHAKEKQARIQPTGRRGGRTIIDRGLPQSPPSPQSPKSSHSSKIPVKAILLAIVLLAILLFIFVYYSDISNKLSELGNSATSPNQQSNSSSLFSNNASVVSVGDLYRNKDYYLGKTVTVQGVLVNVSGAMIPNTRILETASYDMNVQLPSDYNGYQPGSNYRITGVLTAWNNNTSNWWVYYLKVTNSTEISIQRFPFGSVNVGPATIQNINTNFEYYLNKTVTIQGRLEVSPSLGLSKYLGNVYYLKDYQGFEIYVELPQDGRTYYIGSNYSVNGVVDIFLLPHDAGGFRFIVSSNTTRIP